MFVVYEFGLDPNLLMSKPVSDRVFTEFPFEYFDKDGFDLNKVEHQIYLVNDIPLRYCLNRMAYSWPWIDVKFEGKGLYIDHSMVLGRWGYSGELREQIKKYAKDKILLNKLLYLKPKWGFDIDIEYVTRDYVCELIHLERDYFDYEQYLTGKRQAEEFVLNTDFDDAVRVLMHRKDKWEYLDANDQNDYKSKYFGFNKAYSPLKVI